MQWPTLLYLICWRLRAQPPMRPVDDATMEEWGRIGFDTAGPGAYPFSQGECDGYCWRPSVETAAVSIATSCAGSIRFGTVCRDSRAGATCCVGDRHAAHAAHAATISPPRFLLANVDMALLIVFEQCLSVH